MGTESRAAQHKRIMKPVTLHVATRAALDEALARHGGNKAKMLGEALVIVEKQTGEVTHGAANALAKHLGIHVGDVYIALYDFQAGGAAKKKLLAGKRATKVMEVPAKAKAKAKKQSAAKKRRG